MIQSRFLVMMHGIIAILLLCSFSPIVDQVPASEREAMVADWERAKAYTREYLNAVTDDAIAFEPTADMRTFGQQMLHIAESNYGFGSMASGKASPVTFGDLEGAVEKYKTKEALTKAVMDSYDYIISALKETDESSMGDSIKIFNRFEMTRKAAFEKAFEHQTHHRGQTTVYLRLKGITPPNEKLF